MTDNHDKQRAMDLAEDARETEWKYTSFVAELFRGTFRWDMLHPFPKQDPEDKRLGDEFIEKVRAVLEKHLDPEKVDKEGQVPKEALKALGEIGCFGLKIPTKYGGMGFSQTNYNRIVAFVASYCTSTAVWLSAHQSIGVPQPLKMFGTDEQKQKYLPRFAKGAVSGFALTEPHVGSDPAKMTTKATPSEDGSYYILNGEKLWCTNGPDAEVLVVMALTPPKIVDGKEKPQITAFIVETDTPGFEVVHRCSFMGIRGISNGLLRFTNVKVPAENIIGQPGQGLKIALTTLNTGRLTMPSTSVAAGKVALHFSKDWSNERIQWGAPIGKHQAVGRMIADMTANTFAMDSMTSIACAFVDHGAVDIRLEAAMAKYFATETGWQVLDDFLQVRGGRGYETTESLAGRGEKPIPAERMLRDARISRIIEGTSEIMRLFIAREAMDTHVSRVLPIMLGKGERGPLIVNALKFYSVWYPKTWLPAFVPFKVGHLNWRNRRHLTYVGKTAKRMARRMFHTMAKYGPKLEYEQVILQSFVDIGTLLFAMAASLAHAESLLADDPRNEQVQDVADLFCRNAREQIRDAFRAVSHSQGKLIKKVSRSFMQGGYDWMVTDVYTDFPPPARDWQKVESGPQMHAETVPPVPEPQETPK